MNAPVHPMLFVNLAVKDLPRTMEFFSALGFDYDRRFCDDNAACMIVNDRACVMLLKESFFGTFTDRRLCDTTTHTEGLFAISCERREAVDAFVDRALARGGTVAKAPVERGFMYSRSFYDLDGHHWEVLWMDVEAAQDLPAEPALAKA